ncbi:glycosyltransferase family 2 protein [Silvibacterium sp.]|uniref:glycosyltransferase family 2 protein n=1 Tax=Silvibacterium sp. TaxID=1964179 RepID=UPI0039E31B24
MQSGQLTVGLPVRNAMPLLAECMQSLLAQSDPNFHILAIVDGGSDESGAYLRSLRHPRLRVIEQEGQGVARTLNRMLLECETPWLVRQDADDIAHPHRIARLRDAIARQPDAGMFYSFANYHPRGRAMGCFRSTRGSPEELRAIVRSGYLLAICHSSAALNVRSTLACGGYRIGLHNEDADLWWRMALWTDVCCIPEVLVGFRQNAGSVSSRHLAEQMIAGLYVQYLLLSHLSRREPRSIEAVRAALQQLLPQREREAKEQLRICNMALAGREFLRAGRHFGASCLASPGYVWRRMRDEYFTPPRIANGLPPHLFHERTELLWS